MSSVAPFAMICSGTFFFILSFFAFRDKWKYDKRREYKLFVFSSGFISIWICFTILVILLVGDWNIWWNDECFIVSMERFIGESKKETILFVFQYFCRTIYVVFGFICILSNLEYCIFNFGDCSYYIGHMVY